MQVPAQSPRPTPEFFEVPCFSHRKRTPNRAPPKAPVKSCPPVSRIFSSPYERTGAHVISFKSDSHSDSECIRQCGRFKYGKFPSCMCNLELCWLCRVFVVV